MKNNDKVLAALLVSLGLFSTTQATQYVSGLSSADKQALCSAVETPPAPVVPTGPKTITIGDN